MSSQLDPTDVVKGYRKLTEIYGRWPSFHDAEVLNMSLERRGRDEWEGPVFRASVHIFEGVRDEEDSKGIKYINHAIVTFRFATVVDLSLGNFNQQNAIMDLVFEAGSPRSKDVMWGGPAYQITFESSFGVSCSFVCSSVEIDSIEKACPPGSVYA